MLNRLLPSVALVMLLAFTASTHAQSPTLKVGDKAPPLSDGRWVKGEPVKEFESGKVYIVEFWATWCGPCVAVIPHVTELQHKYADKGLIVIGQNVWEDDEAKVEPFIERMGDKMDYRVVLDHDNHMATKWMEAAGRNGIPCSFIIDQQGKIAWIGHPASMEPIVEKVLAGNFDAAAEGEKDRQIEALGQRLNASMRAGDVDAALKITEEVAGIRPELAEQMMMVRFRILASVDRWDEAYVEASRAVDKIENAEALNELAWMIVAPDSRLPKKDLDVAMKAAEKSNELTKGENPAILDTLARAHFLKGNKERARELQQKAVDLEKDPEMKKQLEETLQEYR